MTAQNTPARGWEVLRIPRRVVERASLALRVHCAELLLERGHGKPAQAVAVVGHGEGNKSLRDLILGSMAITQDDVDRQQRVIEHQPAEEDDDDEVD